MKKEDKELLIKDLCCRTPYRICVEHTSGFRGILHDITVHFIYNDDDTIKDYICHTNFFKDKSCKIEFFKPYLFPMSSMTDEQISYIEFWAFMQEYHKITNFYYENHIDCNGLIPKGLAIDATNLGIYGNK